MSDFNSLGNKFSSNPDLMAKLIVDPKGTLRDAGVDLDNDENIHNMELFVKAAQSNLKAATELVGFDEPKLQWGIGMGCCNVPKILPGPTK